MLFRVGLKRQHYLVACFILALCLSSSYGIPIAEPRGGRLIPRQGTTSAASATATQVSTARSSRSTAPTSTLASITSTTMSSSTSSQQTTASSTTTDTPSQSLTSSTTSSTASSTTTSVSATSTNSSSNILSKSSPYFGYAIGVLVVVCVFGLLLVVLFIRFIVLKFNKKPQPPATTPNTREWRYSQDTELYSPNVMARNRSVTTGGAGAREHGDRHNTLGAEVSERQAFLSTESVTLYPAPKPFDRYTDDDSSRRHSRSLSNTSQSTATPYTDRQAGPISSLHSPPATHHGYIVDRSANREREYPAEHNSRMVPAAAPGLHQPESDSEPQAMPSLIAARASYSDPYRQHTLSSSAGVSRAASTASAYSQLSATSADAPPVPALPLAYAQPRPQMSPDVTAALSSMQSHNPSTDTIYTNEMGTTAPPTTEGHERPTLRQNPGRMGWGTQAPASIHSHADLFFDQPQPR